MSLVPFGAHGADILSCEQKQNLCETQCQITNINDESGLKTCKAQCLGERVSCSISSGAQTAKEAAADAREVGEDFGDKAKAFWEGVTK
ncbi:hypothetical protein [Sansalvadorimonas verongulae]|uniref:hypothetical protein n=1 Tax=Sansalvadorimonas verongulae TaxID=2172824 RepID=UPI0012BB869A|nr:hypothetical protein [Sansalvadorimonas verongulae]MTI14624.1 hypothetical protein [Sansalvadorimonas verongulae]